MKETMHHIPISGKRCFSLLRGFRFPAVLVLILLPVFAGVHAAWAATYYVAMSGTDADAGTKERPFRTIQKAADIAVAGDTVFVRAGVYRETVVIKNSGAAGKPIVFEGERGPNGERKTIIDPGRPVKNWIPAPEIGWGVYKTTELNFNPYSMTVDGKQLLRISNKHMKENKGAGLLNEASAARVKIPYYEGDMNFWDAVEALYGNIGGITYIRFRKGDDPNRMKIAAAGVVSCITILNRSNVVIRGFLIRGAYEGVKIEGPGAQGNLIENNYITSAHSRVGIRSGAAGNIIDGNEMTQDYYGYADPGAWQVARADERSALRERVYFMSKQTESDFGIIISAAGDGNEIRNNHIFSGQAGIYCALAKKISVHHNVIHNMSGVGITTRNGVVEGEFHDNFIFDCNYNIRIQNYNTAGDNERSEYYYRNLFYEPEGEGVHIFVHYFDGGLPPDTKHPQIFFYQNSFAGGLAVLQPSSYAGMSGGMANTRFLNNIFEGLLLCRFCYHGGFYSTKGMIGAFDYNWVDSTYSGGLPAWFGEHNVKAEGRRLWPVDKMPDFRLTADSPARHKGIDLSRPFSLAGKTFGPLPGMRPRYFSGPAPDPGALQYGETSPLVSYSTGK